jgi:hypothetical protein
MDQYPPLSQLGGYSPPLSQQSPALPNTQVPSPPLQYNLGAADQALDLTSQEKNLYRMHLRNLTGSGGVDHPDGSRSSLYQTVQQGPDGRYYNIPTVWNGKIETQPYVQPGTGKTFDVANQTALDNVAKLGWKQFPAYDTPEQADERYDAMHKFMDQDTGLFLASRKQNP